MQGLRVVVRFVCHKCNCRINWYDATRRQIGEKIVFECEKCRVGGVQ